MIWIDGRVPVGALLLAIAAPASCFAPDYAVGAGGSGTSPGTGGGSTTSTTSSSTSSGTAGNCKTAGDCPGDETECAHRTCTAGQCGVDDSPEGFLVGAQTMGDCQKTICDGKGAVTTAADDADQPTDGNACTVDLCTAGKPSHSPATKGTVCGANSQLTCDGAGNCAGCVADTDCGVSTPCAVYACDLATTACKVTYVAAGMGDPGNQQVGDCKKNVCNGKGGNSVQNDDSDLPDDGNACTQDVCSMGTPSHAPAPAGTSCGGKFKCDGSGSCAGCIADSDCGQNDACATFACTAGSCESTYVPNGQGDPGGQVTGDCKKNVCNGGGSPTTISDDTDKPIDGNICTNDVCANGVPSNPPVGAGTSCGGALQCDGAGGCKGCLTNADCGAGTACTSHVCQAGTCVVQNASAGTSCGQSDVCDGSGNCVCSDPAACDGKCGSFNNACNVPVSCGGCYAPGTCGGGGTANVCGCTPEPVATTCAGKACGPVTNNCGTALTCPDTCVAPNTCGGGGAGANACGCAAEPVATTCAGKACGPATNNCGTGLTCPDTCVAPNTCGGGGAGANACGCTADPVATTCAGKACGPATNNCGTGLTCPDTCVAPNTCAGGGAGANACGCTPNPDPCGAFDCGNVPNGCGPFVSCGVCTAPDVCKFHLCQL